MKNFKTFPDEIKRQIIEVQNGYCYECVNPVHSIHHKLPNTKHNREKFPLFIHSPMNGVGLCYFCHKNKSHKYKVTEKEAEIYEQYIQGGV